MLNLILGSSPLTLIVISFFAGLIIGYLFLRNRTQKLKRRVLELEEDLLRHDARQLSREAKESKQLLHEAPPLK